MHTEATAFTESFTKHLRWYPPSVKLAHEDLSPLLKHVGLTQVLRDNAHGGLRFGQLGTLLPHPADIGASLREGLDEGVVVDAIASQHDVSAVWHSIGGKKWCDRIGLPVQSLDDDVGARMVWVRAFRLLLAFARIRGDIGSHIVFQQLEGILLLRLNKFMDLRSEFAANESRNAGSEL